MGFFFIGNPEKFLTNSSVHNINTRNKQHFHRPVANLSCFQKGASYCGIRIFNGLTRSITNLKNEKINFKLALKKFLNAHTFYCVDEVFTCKDDTYYWLYECLNVYFTVIFYVFLCLWHVAHPIVLWLWRIYGIHACMYVCMCLCGHLQDKSHIIDGSNLLLKNNIKIITDKRWW